MKKIYIGPLWGKLPSDLLSAQELQGAEIFFYGGYNFFDSSDAHLINRLEENKDKLPLRFNLSRFEEYFLIACDLITEKNYSFKRWINPLSGILSLMDLYKVRVFDFFDHPEAIHHSLLPQLEKAGHLNFYKALESGLFPLKIENLIEESIQNREAFKELCIYNEEGEVIISKKMDSSFLSQYIEKTLKIIADYSAVQKRKD